MADEKKSIYSKLITIGSYSYSYTFLQFLSSMVISRLLDPNEYGLVAMITVFSGFISYFKDAGISYVVIREDYGISFIRKTQALAVLVGLILMFIVASLAYPIAWFYNQPLLVAPTFLVALVLFIETASIVPMALLKKEQRFKNVGQTLFVGYFSGSIITIALAYLQFSYWSLILGQCLAVIIIFILLQRLTPLYFGDFNSKSIILSWRKIRHTFFNISGSRFIQYWSSNADNLIIGKGFGAYSLGIYNRAYQLLTMQMNLISGIFNAILLPSLKEEKKTGDKQLAESYFDALSLMALIILPVTISLVVFSTEIITIIWGENWTEVAPIAAYFGVMSIPFILSRTFGNIYVLFHKENLLFKIGLISSTLSVSAIIFGSFYGLEEVALSMGTMFTVVILPGTLFLAFYKNFNFNSALVLNFWGPIILLSSLMFYSMYIKHDLMTYFILAVYGLHIIYKAHVHVYKVYNKIIGWIRI